MHFQRFQTFSGLTSANCDGPDEKGRETESCNASHTAGDDHHDSAVKPFAVRVQCAVNKAQNNETMKSYTSTDFKYTTEYT